MNFKDEHIEPARARESIALMAASGIAVALVVAIPVGMALFAADMAAWGLQLAGRYARRGTGRALVWLIGQATKPMLADKKPRV